MKFVSIVGARPQFVKAAALSRALRRTHTEILVHTGQHYDANMSSLFFEELGIPTPDVNLGIGSGPHGEQTGKMLAAIEEIITAHRPDSVIVYGDTNSTLAGALAAAKLNIPVAHVEAGLRSFNREMPEEINRIVTDHVSTILFCPSPTAAENLLRERVTSGVHVVGDIMSDSLALASGRLAAPGAPEAPRTLSRLGLDRGEYVLTTVHRAENTTDKDRLRGILDGIATSQKPVVFPTHPRTRRAISTLEWSPSENVRLTDPVGYLDMIELEQNANMILTDSGGIQKEAYWLKVPCLTLRDETEWIETVKAGWNRLVGTDAEVIAEAIRTFRPPATHEVLYGDGEVASRCVDLLSHRL